MTCIVDNLCRRPADCKIGRLHSSHPLSARRRIPKISNKNRSARHWVSNKNVSVDAETALGLVSSAERRSPAKAPSAVANEFGRVLKLWRNRKRLSQMKLAQLTGLSPRHVCFLEVGRAAPRRRTAIELAAALDVPERELPMFLAAAGFSHQADVAALDDPALAPLRESLEFVLRQHNPFPAAVVDVTWNVLLKNLGYKRFLRFVRAEYGLLPEVDTFFHRDGLRRCNTNWDDTVAFAAQRLHGEVLRGRTQLASALERILSYPGIPSDWRTRAVTSERQPMLHVDIALAERQLNFFATFTTFWTVNGAQEQDIGVMSWFPRDDSTQEFCIKHFST